MKKIVFLLLVLCSVSGVYAQKSIIIRIENPLNTERTEVVAISWDELNAHFPKINPEKIIVTPIKTAASLPYQLETKGENQIQNLLLYVTIQAGGYNEYIISEGNPEPVSSSVFCRYVPERKDDFAWENDCIAFRMYGKALENTRENALGIDVWTKKVNSLVIDKWYKTNDYHTDHGEGLDFYSVGTTLGAGDIAPYEHNTIWYPANYRRWKILDNGPLRTAFCLEYDTWDVNGRPVSVTKTITLDKGSQLNKVDVSYQWNDEKPMHLVVGLAKRKEAGTLLLDEAKGMMVYWEPAVGSNGSIGTACLLQTPSMMGIGAGQLLGHIILDKPEIFTYYNGAAWDKAGRITSAGAWIHYLERYHLALQNPLKVNMYVK